MGNSLYRKSDRKAIILLLVMALAGMLLFYYSGEDMTDGPSQDSIAGSLSSGDGSVTAAGDSIKVKKTRVDRSSQYIYNAGERQTELFPFDPNTADSVSLLRLGLQPWQVRSIYKYRSSGGVFTQPSDFARLYGLTVGQYRRLEPYIRISPDFLPASSLPEAALPERDTLKYPVKLTAGEQMVLNTADTTQLRRVPGIGRAFARMIVNYGERLGGYVSVSQLDEIDGFPEEAKAYFVVKAPVTRRMNINKMTVTKMHRHPYMTFHQAQAISDYRRLYGPLHSLQDMKWHRDFTPENISRLEPYVEF